MTRVLFLDQGRAAESAALGHVRAEHAYRLGLEEADGFAADFATVPPFTLPQRIFIRDVPGLGGHGFKTARWHIARGWAALQILRARARGPDRPDVAHVLTDQVSFLLGRIQDELPCVLSLDITTYDWLRLLRRLEPDAPMPGDLRPLVALERRALERAPLSIAWTQGVAQRVGAIAPRAPVEVLHPGIDLTTFRPGDGHSRSGEGRVLFVGGRWEDKGGPDLLAALGDDLGRGVELDVVTPAAIPSRPGLTVRSAGPGSPEVLGLFRRADVLCLPTYVDAVPWVVIEAMACGVPVVATDVGSIPELVGDAGRIVAPGDRTGLRAALLGLLADADLRAALGAAGRAAAEERFDARRNTGRLLSLLADVAASAGARAGRTRSGRPA